jgi:hypothetical protein
MIELAQAALLQGASVTAQTPGIELLLDFDNERPVIRRVLASLAGGSERLEQASQSEVGLEQERCVCEALELLLSALGLDRMISFLPGVPCMPLQTRLDELLVRDRRRVAELFSFVRHHPDPAVQTAAVRTIHAIAQRNERVADSVDAETMAVLRRDVAEALERGLLELSACDEDSVPPSAATAHAIQLLLLDSLRLASAPGHLVLAHLLLGFGFSTQRGDLVLEPEPLSALSVLLASTLPGEGGGSRPWHAARERTLEILCLLASHRHTASAAVGRIRAALPLSAILVAAAGKRVDDAPAARASSLHCGAWLLRLTAAVLYQTPDSHASGARAPPDGDAALLRALLVSGPPPALSRPLLSFLGATSWSFDPPVLDERHARRLLALELGFLLAPDKLAQHGGVLQADKGTMLYDVAAVDALLRSRHAQLGCVPGVLASRAASPLTPVSHSAC